MKQILIVLCCLWTFNAVSQCEGTEYPAINKEYVVRMDNGSFGGDDGAYVGNDGYGSQFRALQSWDLSAIPDNARILSVTLTSESDYEGSIQVSRTCEIVIKSCDIENLASVSSAGSAWNALGGGNEFGTFSGPISDIDISFTGGEIASAVEACLEKDFFAISIAAKENTSGLWWSYNNTNLEICWTTEPPEEIDNVISIETGLGTIIEGDTGPIMRGHSTTSPSIWQQRVSGGDWENIPGSIYRDYNAPDLFETTMYRRIVNGEPSNIITVEVIDYCSNGELLLTGDFTSWHTYAGEPEFLLDNFNGHGPTIDLDDAEGVFRSYTFWRGKEHELTIWHTGYKREPAHKIYLYAANMSFGGGSPTVDNTQLIGSFNTVSRHSTKKEVFKITPEFNFKYILITAQTGWGTFLTNLAIKRPEEYTIEQRVFIPLVFDWLTPPIRIDEWNYPGGENISFVDRVIVTGGAKLNVIADESISITQNFKVESGSYFSAKVLDIYNDCIENNNVSVKSIAESPSKLMCEEDSVQEIEKLEIKESVNLDEIEKNNLIEGFVNIKVFPNPNDGLFTVRVPDDFDFKRIAIANASGKFVYLKDCENQKNLDIDIRNMPPGVYFIKLISLDKVISRKIIKE